MRPSIGRAAVVLAAAVVVAGLLSGIVAGRPVDVLVAAATAVSIGVAVVVQVRRPPSAVGPALAWCGAAPLAVSLAETYGASADGPDPWPAAVPAADAAVGLWPLNVAGLVALLLVFPGGLHRGWVWRAPVLLLPLATAATVAGLWGTRQVGGVLVGGSASWWRAAMSVVGIGLVALSIAIAVAAIVRSARAADERRRLQVRWLALAGVVAGALLGAGWVAEALGASLALAYGPHLLAIVLLVPAAVAVAILRYDLFDVERVLGGTLSVVVTAVGAAAVFSGVVFVVGRAVGAASETPSVTAAFVAALVLLPLHQRIARTVGRLVDRERHVALAVVERFVADVRAGRRQPEELEEVLRSAQGDPYLRLVVRRPDGTWSDESLAGDSTRVVQVTAGGDRIAGITLGRDSARARRRISALVVAAWLPLEVSRLRLGLREAVAEVEASRLRLAEAASIERRRLERDLHDSAQQRIVATGMRLRRLQRELQGAHATEVDRAVADLEDTVRELRSVAHGIRPARLDDGLGAALEAVRAASPVPVTLRVEELPPANEARTATAYFVVSEAVTNALKHARAHRIDVAAYAVDGRVGIEVSDDGVGGAPESGPITLRDRVASVGGTMTVNSPAGGGTTVRAVV